MTIPDHPRPNISPTFAISKEGTQQIQGPKNSAYRRRATEIALQSQALLVKDDDDTQWRLITEKGTVLSHYIRTTATTPFRITINDIPLGTSSARFKRLGATGMMVGAPDGDTSRVFQEGLQAGQVSTKETLENLKKFIEEKRPRVDKKLGVEKHCRIIFCENLSDRALRCVGNSCGLKIGDWSRATRWTSLPSSCKMKDDGIWMFFEISTMWKSGESRYNVTADDRLKWRPRRMGILFSKRGEKPRDSTDGKDTRPWVFLVLIEPSDEELRFCCRHVENSTALDTANAKCTFGPCYYAVKEMTLPVFIQHVVGELRKHHDPITKLVNHFGKDIFWSWEEFLGQVMQRTSMRNVSIVKWRKALESSDPCWELFTYKLMLAEARYLSRALAYLTEAAHILFPQTTFRPSLPEGNQQSPYTLTNTSSSVDAATEVGTSNSECCHEEQTSAGSSREDESRSSAENLSINPHEFGVQRIEKGRSDSVGKAAEDPFEFTELEDNLKTVKDDIEKASELLKDTIEMLYSFVSIREAGNSLRSGYNMEYLAFLAAIFLPVTVFTGVFGMNIKELGQGNQSWWIPFVVTVPSSILIFVGIYLGRDSFIERRKRKNERRENQRYTMV